MRAQGSPLAELQAPSGAPAPHAPLAELLWDSPLGLALLDGAGRVLRGNPGLAALLGSPLDALIGRPLHEAIPSARAPIEHALASGQALASVELCSAPPLVATLQPGGGGLLCVLQAAPQEAAEILRQLPAAVIVQAAGEPLRGNDRLCRMLGAADSAGLLAAVKEVRRLDGTRYGFDELPALRALKQGQTVLGEEMVIVRADGSELQARVSAVPVRDHRGQVIAGAAVCEDVSVRRRLEEEQQKLLSLLESSGDCIAVVGLDGQPLYLNQAALRLVGLHDRDEALGRPLRGLVAQTGAALEADRILATLLAGERWRGELSILHARSGEAIPVEAAAFCIGLPRPSAVAFIARDVRESQREKAERERLVQELEAKQSLLDAVLQQMPAGVIVAEAPGGKLLFSNEQAEAILRRALFPVEAGAPARMSLGERPDGTPIERDDWPLSRSLQKGEVARGEEIEVVRGDGTRALLRCNSAPLRDGRGQLFAAMVVFEDVTEEKRGERALLESEARFRRLAESGMIGVFFAEGELLADANDSFLSFIGRGRAELEGGLKWRELCPREHRARDDRALEEVRARGVCQPFEKDFLQRDGTRVPALVGAAQLEEGRDAWVFFVLDNRERKRAEELQRQLMGIVSHDLRSPLSAVNMASAMLLNADDLPERHVKTAARIHASSERMRGLIGDLLDYQQARVGRGLPLVRRPCDLATVCTVVLQELEMVHAGRDLRYDPGEDGRGSWDPGRLSQVVQNLLGNAVSHSPPGTPVHLAWTSGDDGFITLVVKNDGPPIPADFMPHLFQPFRRARDLGDGSQGFGLGLFIVHEIVRAHGGTVAVRSAEGEGTTFTVRLPRS